MEIYDNSIFKKFVFSLNYVSGYFFVSIYISYLKKLYRLKHFKSHQLFAATLVPFNVVVAKTVLYIYNIIQLTLFSFCFFFFFFFLISFLLHFIRFPFISQLFPLFRCFYVLILR